jgi:hypothetical protein
MTPITDRSNPPAHNASKAPTPADGKMERIVSGCQAGLHFPRMRQRYSS